MDYKKTSSELIQEYIGKYLNNECLEVIPKIDSKKLQKIANDYEIKNYKSIVAIYETLKIISFSGLVFLGDKFYFKKNMPIPYNIIKKAECKQNISKGKIFGTNKEENLLIFLNNDCIYHSNYANEDEQGNIYLDLTEFVDEKNRKSFADFINFLISKKSLIEIKNEDLLDPLENKNDELKKAYMKIVVNAAYNDDFSIDSKEQAEIFLLMNRINMSQQARFEIREYMFNISDKNIEDLSYLVDIIKKEAKAQYRFFIISLIKDLINLIYVTKGKKIIQNDNASSNLPNATNGNISFRLLNVASSFLPFKKAINIINNLNFEIDDKYIKELQNMCNVSYQEIRLICDSIENDYKILNGEINDSDIVKTLKDSAAKAAGVGLPLGSLYASGSVVGFSAAGITSGLSTLGMGGLFGLSSMVTGVGTLVVIGIGTYQAIKYFTADKTMHSNYRLREMMLCEVLKQNQKTISCIIEDINCITSDLNKVIDKENELNLNIKSQEEKIRYLVKKIAEFTNISKAIESKSNELQNMDIRFYCPKELDTAKLEKIIKSDLTKEDFIEFIKSCYEKIQPKDGKDIYQLKDDLSTEDLIRLQRVLKEVGY